MKGKHPGDDVQAIRKTIDKMLKDTMKEAFEDEEQVEDFKKRWGESGKGQRIDFLVNVCNIHPKVAKRLALKSCEEFSRKELGVMSAREACEDVLMFI